MTDSNAKGKLVNFLDRKAFDPVLNASADDYSQSKQDKLKHAKNATRRARDRYHNDYRSAEAVRDNFHNDLSSDEAKKVDRELRELNLPTLQSVQGDFDKLCRDLSVGSA